MKAIDQIKEIYITENELAEFLGVDTKRIRDLRSNHVTGKQEFMDCIKPTSRVVLYRRDDVIKFLEQRYEANSFGKFSGLEKSETFSEKT